MLVRELVGGFVTKGEHPLLDKEVLVLLLAALSLLPYKKLPFEVLLLDLTAHVHASILESTQLQLELIGLLSLVQEHLIASFSYVLALLQPAFHVGSVPLRSILRFLLFLELAEVFSVVLLFDESDINCLLFCFFDFLVGLGHLCLEHTYAIA